MNARLAPLFCLAGAVLLWGTSFAATKCALAGFSPAAAIFLRMAVAGAVALPFLRRAPRTPPARGDAALLALLCLLEPCLYFLCEANAVRLTTSAQAGMVAALAPLFVAVGARAFLKEPLSRRMAAGLALSLGGVAWLSFAGGATESAPNPALGNFLELCAMCCAAGYMLLLKRLSSRYDSWTLTMVQIFAGALFFLPLALWEGGGVSAAEGWLAAPRASWLAVGYLGGVVTLGAFGLYNMAMTRLPAARAAASINLVPVVAVLTGWAFLGERLGLGQAGACALILAGMLLGRHPGRVRPRD